MKELKTLMDLEKYADEVSANGFFKNGYNLALVHSKEEAVKWVKANKINEWYGEQTILFIKHFFNLTEEDLK